MKHNWEYRPFDRIAHTITPISKIEKSEYLTCGLVPIISQEETVISGYWNNSNDVTPHQKPVVIFGDHSRVLKYIDFEFVVGADGVKIIEPKEDINTKFLYYYLHWLNIPSLGYARHFKLVKEALYAVPPMEVQEQIVAELDKINELIEQNSELLRHLDSLAQSLFYDIFGDPNSNEKGWKVSKLGNICEISSAKRVLIQDVVDRGIPFIRGTELALLSKQTTYDPSVFSMFISAKHYEKVKSITGVPEVDDLLIPSINSDGYVWQVNTPNPFYFKDGRVLWVHVNHSHYSSKWLKYTLSQVIQEKYASLSRGAVFAELTLVFMRNLPVILPSLTLQEQFATKVEAIEAQKVTVEKSIAELQTLLDSRMDYWFN
jgi:type I restriction enzyme S subunit